MIFSIILAAGEGKRMFSKVPKVLHKICGREMIFYAIDAVKNISEKTVVVISENISMEVLGEKISATYQKIPLGTADAVKCGLEVLRDIPSDSLIVITTGDNPLVKERDITSFIEFHLRKGNEVSLLSGISENPSGLGRVVRNWDEFIKIVEEKDAREEEKKIKEINTGIYIFRKDLLEQSLKEITNENAQKEFYLTDSLAILKSKGAKIGVKVFEKLLPVYGVNNRFELYRASKAIQWEILENLMKEGVSIINPETVNIDYGVKVSQDVMVLPGVILEGSTNIDSGCVIGPNTKIANSIIGRNSTVQYSVVLDSLVGEECSIGPFAYVRPGNILANKVKIGTFVEVKKSRFNESSKAPHLSYIGDATVGKNVNIGAGTITCNFSGLEGDKKNATLIEDDVFIGSNSTLVAPLIIRKGAYTAAGSVVTEEVPENSLAIGRAKQVNKEGWAKRRKGSNGKRSSKSS